MQTQAIGTQPPRPRRILACTLLLGTTTTGAVVVLGRVAVAAWRPLVEPGPATIDEAAAAFSVSVAAVLLAGWTVSMACALVEHLPGRLGHVARAAAPHVASRPARRLAAVLLGATLTGAFMPGGAASATTPVGTAAAAATSTLPRAAPPHPGFVASVVERLVTPEPPGWTPTRPRVRPQPATSLVTSGADRRAAGEVVVQRGDCLWDIAARHLGPGASDAEVAIAWPAWHEANRALIGDDPDRLLPGQLLHAPSVAPMGAP